MEKFQRNSFRSCDRPCSSLALNCCQFGCCIINDALARDDVLLSYERGKHADWMAHLTKIRPSVKLRDLRLVGSHDAGSCTISKTQPFSAIGITQNGSITQQLEQGVRHLDIRIAGSSSASVSIFHGPLQGTPFVNVLKEISSFLTVHSGEVIVIDLVAEHGRSFTLDQKQSALRMVNEVLGDFLCKNVSYPSKIWKGHTLQKLVKDNTRVVLLTHPRIWSDVSEQDKKKMISSFPYIHSHECMYNEWHNTRESANLLQWNLEEVRSHGFDQDKLLANQMVMTPGFGGLGDVLGAIVGNVSLRPVSFASQLIPCLSNYFREHSDEPWNIIVLDFCDLVPALVSFWIGLNFLDTLQIVQASCSNIDVTKLTQKYVCSKKVLYLSNIVEDLNLDMKEGLLKLEYKLTSSRDAVHELELEYDEDTQVVLSQYSHIIMKRDV